MPKAVVEDIESVDESLRPYYKEDGGRYVLDVEPVEIRGENGSSSYYALEDVHGLRTAVQRERANARKYQEQAGKYGDLDPETARAALDELETLRSESGDLQSKAQQLAESKVEQMSKKHQSELQKVSSRADAYRNQLENVMIDQALASAIRSQGGDEGTVELLMPHMRRAVKLHEDGERFVAEVIDPSTGQQRIGDSMGSPMSLEQLVSEYKSNDRYAIAFPGTGKSGGGTPSSGKRGGGLPAKSKKSDYSPSERSDFIEQNGALAWLKIPD